MAIRLEKLVLPTVSEIEFLAQQELINLAKDWRERLEYYQGLLFRAKKKQFGRSSEKSKRDDSSIAIQGSDDPPKKDPAPRADTTKKLSERYSGCTRPGRKCRI